MSAPKRPAQIVIVDHDWDDDPPPRREGGKTAQPTTVLPWQTYDQFLLGQTIAELAIAERSGDALILSDIAQMRDEMRRMNPGVTDQEADHIREEDLLIRQCATEGSPQALKLLADARIRRRKIQEAGFTRLKKT